MTDCPTQFATRILTDLGLCEGKVNDIIDKLSVSNDVYNSQKPTTTISIIANDLYQCLKPTANDIARITADEINRTLIYILIVTAIFIVLTVIIMVILDNTIYSGWSILIAVIFGILYIGVVFLLSYNAQLNISISITNSQNRATECVNQAVAALTLFEQQQTAAISNGLCAYTDTTVTC
jgi:hypothetical protein